KDLPLWTVLGPPLLDPPLEAAQLALPVPLGAPTQQILEERLRLQLRRLLQSRRNFLPILGERILPGPPHPRPLQLRREPIRLHVPPRRVSVHPGAQSGRADVTVLAHLVHQFPHLRILDHSPASPFSRRAGLWPLAVASGRRQQVTQVAQK